MLVKSKRLNLKTEFTWVAGGQRAENDLMKLFFRFGGDDNPKVGIATAKATFKDASDRNRARRLTSIGFEKLYPCLCLKVKIIALPKRAVLQVSSEEVTKSLEELLNKKGLLNNEITAG